MPKFQVVIRCTEYYIEEVEAKSAADVWIGDIDIDWFKPLDGVDLHIESITELPNTGG